MRRDGSAAMARPAAPAASKARREIGVGLGFTLAPPLVHAGLESLDRGPGCADRTGGGGGPSSPVP